MISDREHYESILQKFVGRTCHRTLACNSIKLRLEQTENITDRGYIWIDPPWAFMHHQQFITDSSLCPRHEEEDYTPRSRDWCNLFFPLDQTTFTRYEFASDESLTLLFSDFYQLYIPTIEPDTEDAELWYWHWYAYQIQNGT